MLLPVAISRCYKQVMVNNNNNSKLCKWVIVTQTLHRAAPSHYWLILSTAANHL